MDTIWLAFLTGLTTGGISCLAVQGGLLASSVSNQTDSSSGKKLLVGTFLASKLLAYTILGFGLGTLGSSLTITPTLQGWMQIFAGLFMLLTAARLLDLHPVFRYFVIQPPKFAYKLVRSSSKDSSLFSPAVTGFLTVLMPCGITQAIMVLAVASGNALAGAGIMFAFVLGTSPVFFALGLTVTEMVKRKAFAYIAALVIFSLGVASINTGQVLRGSVHTLQNYYLAATTDIASPVYAQAGQVAGTNTEGKQEVTIDVTNAGYSPSAKVLKVGVPVKLKLITNDTVSCTRAFTIPSLNLVKVLPQTGTETVEFTPSRTGALVYSCGMGMYTGAFQVIN